MARVIPTGWTATRPIVVNGTSYATGDPITSADLLACRKRDVLASIRHIVPTASKPRLVDKHMSAAMVPEYPDVTAANPVINLAVSAITDTGLTLTWANPTNEDFASVTVRRAAGATAPVNKTAGTGVTVSAKAETVVETELTEKTQYSYSVFTDDTAGNTSAATSITVTTADVTAPDPVTALSATVDDESSVTLEWTNPVDADLETIIVRRAAGATAPTTKTAGTSVPVTGKPETVTNTGLTEKTQYSWSVFAVDPSGNTSVKTSVTATTADVTAPGPVTDFAAGTPLATSVPLTWTNPEDADLESIVVRVAAGAVAPATVSSGTAVPLGLPTDESVTATGLTAETEYSFAAFAVDDSDNASVAATVTVTTAAE